MTVELNAHSSVAQFSTDLYGQIIEQQAAHLENAFLSPLSIYIACLVTMLGAAGRTLEEMKDTLHIPTMLSDQSLHDSLGSALMKEFTASKEVELSMANRLFVLNRVNITPQYEHSVQHSYLSKVESLENLSDIESKRNYINTWVSNRTKQKIDELIPSGALNEQTILAIVNAIYFKGSWEHPFEKDYKSVDTFFMPNRKMKEIPMMLSEELYPYATFDDLQANAIRLPFNGTLYEMLILLPFENDGLKSLLAELQKPGVLSRVLHTPFIEEQTIVLLPRFKLSKLPSLDVKKLLQELGLKSLFDASSADLSRMTGNRELFVSDVLHKAVLEVDEEGATAAAATGMMVMMSAIHPERQFYVNHPFFLAITYNHTLPVFMGHVVDPEEN